MNKQLIRDLAITGGIYDCLTDPYDKLENGDHHSSVMVDLERFAEKIVRECLAQVDKVDTMLEDDKEKTGVAWVGLAIAKHFGVEE